MLIESRECESEREPSLVDLLARYAAMMRPSFQSAKSFLTMVVRIFVMQTEFSTSDRGPFLDTTTSTPPPFEQSEIALDQQCFSPEIYLARLEKGFLLSLTPNAESFRGSLVSSYRVREFGLLRSVLPFLTLPPILSSRLYLIPPLLLCLKRNPKLSIPPPDTRRRRRRHH